MGNPYLRGVHDENGNLIPGTQNDDHSKWTRNSVVFFAPQDDGTYYIAAGGYGDRIGAYELSVTEFPDDYADGTGTTGAVTVGGSTTGKIDYRGDVDWLAVDLVAGTMYRFDLEGHTLWDPILRGIHDENGVRFPGTTNDNTDHDNTHQTDLDSMLLFTAGYTGTYYVAADARFYRVDTGTGTYTLSVKEVTDDYAAGTDTTGTVTVGGETTGDLERPGDRDWLAVDLEAGTTYRFVLAASTTFHYLKGVFNADGTRVTDHSNYENRASSRISFTPEDAGVYYVAVGTFRDDKIGTYTLSVTQVSDDERGLISDDYAGGTDTTGTVTVGSSTHRRHRDRAGDRDWFAVTLDAGKMYRFDLEGLPTGQGSLADPYLHGIHDANGVRIADTTNGDGGTGDEQPGLLHAGGRRHLLRRGRHLRRRPARHLHAVGDAGHGRLYGRDRNDRQGGGRRLCDGQHRLLGGPGLVRGGPGGGPVVPD